MDVLAHYIREHDLQPRDRLPPERGLTSSLKVGQSRLREAVSQFSALGIVEARIGSGTYLLRQISGDTVYMPLSHLGGQDGRGNSHVAGSSERHHVRQAKAPEACVTPDSTDAPRQSSLSPAAFAPREPAG